jgi:hypothetical protein
LLVQLVLTAFLTVLYVPTQLPVPLATPVTLKRMIILAPSAPLLAVRHALLPPLPAPVIHVKVVTLLRLIIVVAPSAPLLAVLIALLPPLPAPVIHVILVTLLRLIIVVAPSVLELVAKLALLLILELVLVVPLDTTLKTVLALLAQMVARPVKAAPNVTSVPILLISSAPTKPPVSQLRPLLVSLPLASPSSPSSSNFLLLNRKCGLGKVLHFLYM